MSIQVSLLTEQDLPAAASVLQSAFSNDILLNLFEPPSIRADDATRLTMSEDRLRKAFNSGEEVMIKATLSGKIAGVARWWPPSHPVRAKHDEPKDDPANKYFDTEFLGRFAEAKTSMREFIMGDQAH